MKKRWYTTTRYVDHETGEILTKSQWERNDYIVKETLNEITFKNEYNEKIYIKAGKPRGQYKLEL